MYDPVAKDHKQWQEWYGEKKEDSVFKVKKNEDWVTANLLTINHESFVMTRAEAMQLTVVEFLTILRTKINYLKRQADA